MQYEYCIKKNVNSHEMIEFVSNNIYRKEFLDDFLLAINKLDPYLKNNENYWGLNIENKDNEDDNIIKNRFWEYPEIDLFIETLYGKIVLSKYVINNAILQSEDNLELINNVNELLENNHLFFNKK
jgi:hypothetical protein